MKRRNLHVELKDLKEKIENDEALLVDIREDFEWNEGHISGAIHLPLSKIMAGTLPEVVYSQTLYLYCNSGQRTLRAAPLLKDFFPEVVPLKWGFKDLAQYGFSVSK